ncbi:MAG TPA: hypothetical protein VHS32_23085, partial [Streptosporangiaceae bacterium]|nr:hypothetical protein [Streptosporangiaceae bacterium]
PTVVYCPHGPSSCQLGLTHVGTTGDWRYFAALWETTRVSLTDFHQFPSWNPYHCGGIVLFQDPQAPFPGPMFLLTFFWLPTAVGIKLWLFTHILTGMLGAVALVADRGGNRAEQVLAATIVGASGFIAEHFGGGHLAFTSFCFFPVILWAFRRALTDLRYVVVAAGLFALADIQGGTYPVPLIAVGLAIETVARLGSSADRRGLALVLPAFGLLFVLLAGIRLVPVMHYLREHPRLMPLDDALTVGDLFTFWTTRTHSRGVAGHPYVWPEYNDYVGWVPVILMLLGIIVAIVSREDAQGSRRARRIDLVLFLGLLWAALGNVGGPSLFGWLHKLPIYASLRVPARFLSPANMAFALLAIAPLMMTRALLAARGVRPRTMRLVLGIELALVAGVALDISLTNQRVMQQGIDPVLSRAPASAAFRQDTASDYGQFPTFPVRGHGTRACYVPLEWKPAEGIVDGPGPQARVHPPTAGTVTQTRWSPSAIDLDVHLTAEGMVVVNQNYETGWQASAGTVGAYVNREARFWDIRARPSELPAKGAIGLLAIRLPAGDHHLALRHRPRGLWLGALMTLLGIALAVAIARHATPARVARLWARGRTLAEAPR